MEDEKDIRDQLIEILSLDFENILVASNGQEGLDMFNQHQPDLIISDIQMPRMDGLSMCEKIRECNTDVKMILMTAFNEKSFINKAKDQYVKYYITKPIDINKLYTCIHKCLHDEDD